MAGSIRGSARACRRDGSASRRTSRGWGPAVRGEPMNMDRAVSTGSYAAWLAERQGAARELRLYARIFARSAASLLGLGLVLVFLLMAALGPWIAPYPEDARGAVHLDQKLQPPGARHWFGTDEVGADIYTRVILGARVSLRI